MSKPVDSQVLSFRVINRKGETLSTHASRVAATESTLRAVSTMTGEAFTIEGLPTVAGDVVSFRSIL